jgi:asparagine synthase (glutamine-hydrolysing)
MAGIVGLIEHGTRAELGAMADRMRIRGPPLRVLEPAPGILSGECGDEFDPSWTSDLAVLDGAPENLDDLRAALIAHGEVVPDDVAELLATLVIALGAPGLALARGTFAFAAWNPRERALIVAGDPLGFNSVHFVALPGRIAFATDYKAFFALEDFVATPNPQTIQHYLATRNALPGTTFLQGVHELSSAGILECRAGAFRAGHYWRPVERLVHRSLDAHAQVLRETLLGIVRRKCGSYDRIGVTLGAGLDSPSLLAMIRHVRPEAEVATFTIGYGPSDPEIVGARYAAQCFRTEHHEVHFDPESIPLELPRLIWLMEDCGSREEALLQCQVIREASRHVDIVMGGHRADAAFGGMPRHRAVRLAALIPPLRTAFAELYQHSQSGVTPRSPLGKAFSLAVFRGQDYPPPRVLGTTAPARAPWSHDLNQMIIATIPFTAHVFQFLEPVHAMTRVAFATPFFDPDLIDVSLTIPARYKVGAVQQKIILRRAMRGLLPPEIARRPKALQRIRLDRQLSDIVDRMSDELLTADTVRRRGIIDPDYLAALKRRPADPPYARDRLYRLWTLVSLEIWSRLFLDRRGAPIEGWDAGASERRGGRRRDHAPRATAAIALSHGPARRA